jgi:ABC-type branched-subunit amino acid transport system ATPase component
MIIADHLTKRFGAFTAISDVSFEVRRGDVFALLGPNGSGKTTTLKMTMGLGIPTSGRILVDGMDVHDEPKRARSLIAIPQRSFSTPTAREVVHLRHQRNFEADRRSALSTGVSTAGPIGLSESLRRIQRLVRLVSMPRTRSAADEPTASLDSGGVFVPRVAQMKWGEEPLCFRRTF